MSIFTSNYNMSTSDEEDEKTLTCAKCFSIHEDDDDGEYYCCEICNNIICNTCSEKGYYMDTSNPVEYQGICYICMKDDEIDFPMLPIYFGDWRTLHKKYKTIKDSKKSQTKYIAELESEIKLLKTMVDFQPNGKGYIIARENFKQLIDKNDAIDDNQYDDCEDYEDFEDVEDDGNNEIKAN
jgi:hypothetical protein